MIRSNNTTLKYTNKGKRNIISQLVDDYTNITQKYINIIWNNDPFQSNKFIDNEICQQIHSNRIKDSRLRQCASKQASAITRGETTKRRKQLFKLAELQREGIKSTTYLQRKIDKRPISKPKIKNLNIELDSRFVDFQKGNKEFDLFVRISNIGNKEEIIIPIKFNKSFNKWNKLGTLKTSIRLSKDYITFFFEIPEKPKEGTKKIGADQGALTCLSLSDGKVTEKCNHGHDLNSIMKDLERRKKGSKGFRRTQGHRKNYINWSINRLNVKDVKEIELEKITNIRKGKTCSRYLSHWTYTLIKDKLIRLSEEKGFLVIEKDGWCMSQRCSQCGWTQQSNRKGKTFKCLRCGFITDSDLNAASNHEVDLFYICKEVRLKHYNRNIGFYWHSDCIVLGDERIVCHVR